MTYYFCTIAVVSSLEIVTTPLVADGVPRLGERGRSGTGGRSDDLCKESRDDPHAPVLFLLIPMSSYSFLIPRVRAGYPAFAHAP